jgi:hypothetical protein
MQCIKGGKKCSGSCACEYNKAQTCTHRPGIQHVDWQAAGSHLNADGLAALDRHLYALGRVAQFHVHARYPSTTGREVLRSERLGYGAAASSHRTAHRLHAIMCLVRTSRMAATADTFMHKTVNAAHDSQILRACDSDYHRCSITKKPQLHIIRHDTT